MAGLHMMAMRAGTAYLLSFTFGPPKTFQFLMEMVWQPAEHNAQQLRTARAETRSTKHEARNEFEIPMTECSKPEWVAVFVI